MAFLSIYLEIWIDGLKNWLNFVRLCFRDFLIPSLLKTWDQMLNYTAMSGEVRKQPATVLSR